MPEDLSHPSAFPPTRWTRVAALKNDPESVEGQSALAELCRLYWYPLYAFARRKGQSQEDAQDYVQGFFVKMLGQNSFAQADADHGKMRTFLLTLFTRYMMDEWSKTTAKKRGGGEIPLTLDFGDGEQRFSLEPSYEGDHERAFDRSWAESVIAQTGMVLQEECARIGKGQLFEHIGGLITGADDGVSYEDLASRTGLSATNLRQVVHRLRGRFRDLLRQTISDTLSNPTSDAIDAELHALRAALSQ
jgi:DNA-directed RNA polymerase specialized sigma24 family protein